MSEQQNYPPEPKKMSKQLRSVLKIIAADQFLSDAVLPHIDIARESINWDAILKIDLGTGNRGAILFSHAIWTDETLENSSLFECAHSMSPAQQKACLEALAVRWGLAG